jgi:hypothetical protein
VSAYSDRIAHLETELWQAIESATDRSETRLQSRPAV